eukprot:10023877-Heterocapsa_arctica.AAC.1
MPGRRYLTVAPNSTISPRCRLPQPLIGSLAVTANLQLVGRTRGVRHQPSYDRGRCGNERSN